MIELTSGCLRTKASDVYAINRLAGFEGGNSKPLIFIAMIISRMVFIFFGTQ